MCLTKYLDSNITQYNPPLLKIAEDDIIVKKVLKTWAFSTNLCRTPVKKAHVYFRQGVAFQKEDEICGTFFHLDHKKGTFTIYDTIYESGSVTPFLLATFCQEEIYCSFKESFIEIDRGIHSYNVQAERFYFDILNFDLHEKGEECFIAIIPKGARYMEGNMTYVSDELLIFQNDEAYENYKNRK